MTGLLYWNVENFAINKIVNPNTNIDRTGEPADNDEVRVVSTNDHFALSMVI